MVIKSKEIMDEPGGPAPVTSPSWLQPWAHCGNVPGTRTFPAWPPPCNTRLALHSFISEGRVIGRSQLGFKVNIWFGTFVIFFLFSPFLASKEPHIHYQDGGIIETFPADSKTAFLS